MIEGGDSLDERGRVTFFNDFDFKGIKRFYMVENHTDDFRGWHGHKKESKYVFVVSGLALVGVANLDTDKVEWFVMGSDSPQILHIPPNHANGFKKLHPNTKVIFYSDKTLKQSLKDDYRYPADHWELP